MARSVASGGKFYWSPTDKENTAKRTNSSPLKGPITGPCSSSPNGPWYLIFALMQLQSNPHLRPPLHNGHLFCPGKQIIHSSTLV